MDKKQDPINRWSDIISGEKGFYRSLQFMPRGDNSFLSPSPIPRLTAPVQPIRKETANSIEYFLLPGNEPFAAALNHVSPKELEEFRRLASKCESQIADSGLPAEIIETLTNEVLEYIQSDDFAAKISYLCALNAIKDANRIQIKSDMKNEQVVHVCLGDDRHYYFGSVAAIFDRFTPDELGVSLTTLWNYGLAPDRPYKNNRCAIYRGNIDRKKHGKQ